MSTYEKVKGQMSSDQAVMSRTGLSEEVENIPNGAGAAAILAAGIGCAAMGVLAFAGDASDVIGKFLNFYNPTGTLSGVTTLAILTWLVSWVALNRLWAHSDVAIAKINALAFILLLIGFLLTFPPFMDLLQGK
jgi:hypothetical protein